MAAVNFSGIAELRGSIATTTYSRNRGGAYARNRTAPTQPNTADQVAVRDAFSTISALWTSITQAERNTWYQAAPNFPMIDIFGCVRYYSGSVLFQKINMNLFVASFPAINTAPVHSPVPAIGTFTIDAREGDDVIVTNTSLATVPADCMCVLYGTPLFPASQLYLKNKFRMFGFYPNNDGIDGFSCADQWHTKFGALTAGFRIGIKLRLINFNTGIAGVPAVASTIVAA